MANHGQTFGDLAERKEKLASKYDKGLEAEAAGWLTALTGTPQEGEFADWLKDGQVLANAINKLKPGSIKKVNTSKMAFKQMENISKFIEAACAYGVNESDCFQTVDLYEAKNMTVVLDTVHALGRAAQKNKFDGPTIGAKEAEANIRQFDEMTLKAGQSVIGGQAGYTGGANQAGTSFGNTRHM